MTDEEEREDESEEEEYEYDENLSHEERAKRWMRQWLRRQAEKATRKLEKGRKVDKGFEAAFASGENAHKWIRRHEFKYSAEPKDKVPESKPAYGGGEPWKEPSKWIPPKHTEEYPRRKDATETLQILEKTIDDHGRAERADGEGKDAIRKAEALAKDRERKDSGSEDTIAAIEIEAPAHSVLDVTSQIASQMKEAGYDHISTETSASDYTFEPSFLEDDLEKMESAARQDSVSPLELSDIHETLRQHEIENVLEEQRQEMLQDFEIQPPFHDDIAGLTEAVGHVRDALENPISDPFETNPIGNPLKPKVEAEDAEME